MTKYSEVAQAIRTAIVNGEYAAGDRLPTNPQLCELYGVSNTTVKKAMDELELQGLVARRRGSGIYVKGASTLRARSQNAGSTAGQMAGLSTELAPSGKKVTSVVNDFRIVHPTSEVSDALGIGTDEFVYYICRTRLVDGIPRNVEYTFMPLSLVPGLLEKHLHASIYAYLEGELGLKIASAHRVLRAVMPTEDEKTWLELGPDSPLFEVRQVAYLDDGTPFEYSTTHHTCDYEFYVVSTH